MWPRRGKRPRFWRGGNCPDWGFSRPTATLGNRNNESGLEPFWSCSGWANVAHASSPGKLRNFPRMKWQQQSRQPREPCSCNILCFSDNSASVSKPQGQGQARHAEENLYQQAQNSDTEEVAQTREGQEHSALECLTAEHVCYHLLRGHSNEKWRGNVKASWSFFLCVQNTE